MRRGYEILEHPADLGLEACGGSLAEAFEEAAAGLVAVLLDPAGIRAAEDVDVRVEAPDREQLLVRWLSEVLYLVDGRGFAPGAFTVRLEGGIGLAATVRGERRDPDRHPGRSDVKAITYHQLSVRESTDGAVVTVFLDV